jgi:signal peptide peptidase SppA
MIPFHQVRRRLFNQPLLVTQAAGEAVSTVVLERLMEGRGGQGSAEDSGETRQGFRGTQRADGSVEVYKARTSRFYGDYPIDPDSNGRPKPYRRTEQGTAIITIIGELVNRGAWVGASSGLVSYEGIKHQVLTALADARVRNVIMDYETPGGEVVGAMECAAEIRKLAAEKNVVAVVNGMACSGGYKLATGARRIVTMASGLSAHIGVVMLHMDWSAWLKDNGIKPTFIFVGDHKVDGNPFEVLPESVRARFKGECEKYYADFVATVLAGRKNLTEQQVRATQALAYKGDDAVKLGLADEIGTFEDVLAELSRPTTRSTSKPMRSSTMANENTAENPDVVTRGDHDKAVKTAGDTARTEGESVGVKKGEDAAKARVSAIMNHEEAKGREATAQSFALNTAMTVDEAVAALKTVPKAEAGKPSLAAEMRSEPKPNLGEPPAPAGTQGAKSNYDKGREIAMRAKGKDPAAAAAAAR